MTAIASRHGIRKVDGVLLDLGVSSDQLDCAERGFSFDRDGPLDMRMDAKSKPTAADIVNTAPEGELADLLWRWGEERRSRRIARAIVHERGRGRIDSTLALARVVTTAVGGRRGKRHPATRTFQALRMAVNEELKCLEAGLEAGIDLLKEGGRIAVISFHSLEDRVVKECFRRHAGRFESLAAGGEEWRGTLPALELVNRRPTRPSGAEMAANPRSRSAKLRVAERVGEVSRRGKKNTRAKAAGARQTDPLGG